MEQPIDVLRARKIINWSRNGCGALIMAAIVLIWGCTAFSTIRDMINQGDYQPTTGTVIHSLVDSKRGVDRRLRYFPVIQASYSVNGQTYVCDHVSLVQIVSKTPEEVLQYPPGSAITVYYDPESPDKSVLKKQGISELIPTEGILYLLAFVTVASVIGRLLRLIPFRFSRSGANDSTP